MRCAASILDAATPLVALNSGRGICMGQVAGAAGLSRTGLVHHVTSKVALLSAALEVGDKIDGLPAELGGLEGEPAPLLLLDGVRSR